MQELRGQVCSNNSNAIFHTLQAGIAGLQSKMHAKVKLVSRGDFGASVGEIIDRQQSQ